MPAERIAMRQVRDVLRLHAAGVSGNEIARRVGMAPSTVRLTLKRLAIAGLGWPLPTEMTDAALEAQLFTAVGTKQGHRRRIEPDWAAIHRELKRGSSTTKASRSKKSLDASEQDRVDIARRRTRWKMYQGRLDPRCLVFIDETWAKTNMTRRHGRASRGTRLISKVPHSRWRTLTFLAALRYDRIVAPCVSSMGRSTAPASVPMSSNSCCPRSVPATSS